MYLFVISLHVVLCTLLIFIILMQPGKGGDVSSAFGGGASSQLFGAAGPGNFLTQGTAVIAGLFMVTSISLVLLGDGTGRATGDALDKVDGKAAEEEGGGFGAGGAEAPVPDGALPAVPPAAPPAAPPASLPAAPAVAP